MNAQHHTYAEGLGQQALVIHLHERCTVASSSTHIQLDPSDSHVGKYGHVVSKVRHPWRLRMRAATHADVQRVQSHKIMHCKPGEAEGVWEALCDKRAGKNGDLPAPFP